MVAKRWSVYLYLLILCALLTGLAGCAPEPAQSPAPAVAPTLSLDQTNVKDLATNDFERLHSPVEGEPGEAGIAGEANLAGEASIAGEANLANRYLIFGRLPVAAPAADLPAELAVFLGRWEGYSYAPPVKKDRKVVLVIQEINAQGGKAVGWSGTNLQYPDRVAEIHFRITVGDPPAIEFQILLPDGSQEIDRYTYDREHDLLRGWIDLPGEEAPYGPTELTRGQDFYIYKDYAQYLAGKRIYSKGYQNGELKRYGAGYLIYLPEGYEAQPQKSWPLIYFLHGYGDRGENVFLLAKASPLMYIREKGPLPCIIIAPLLNAYAGYPSFPLAYLDGVLAEVQAGYRVDPRRISLTGLSMGGEAAYRLAANRSETLAALAPLSAYVDSETYSLLGNLMGMPVWAIHGDGDTVIALTRGQQPAEALQAIGGNVRFTVLEDHDHDTWTDTYSDPAFYDWLLEQRRP